MVDARHQHQIELRIASKRFYIADLDARFGAHTPGIARAEDDALELRRIVR